MKEAGQSLRDTHLPIEGKPRIDSSQGGGMRRASGAKVAFTDDRASVSSAKAVAIDPVGRLERDVPIRGT